MDVSERARRRAWVALIKQKKQEISSSDFLFFFKIKKADKIGPFINEDSILLWM